MRPPRSYVLLALAASVSLVSCVNLGEFDTDDGDVFAGAVLGQLSPCDAGDCSFIRHGFGAGTRLTMTFDPETIVGEVGRLSTTAADGSAEICGTTFDDVPMMAIVPVQYDKLSLYDFPGGGRLRNFMYSVRPTTGPLAGRDVMAFVSLLENHKIEVRLLSGPGTTNCDPNVCAPYAAGDCDFYGVFTLARTSAP